MATGAVMRLNDEKGFGFVIRRLDFPTANSN
jgi:cold shock CspA family protein